MDPITTTILAVLGTIGSEVVKSGVKDAYESLKAVIRRKWGEAAPISKVICAIEEDYHALSPSIPLTVSMRAETRCSGQAIVVDGGATIAPYSSNQRLSRAFASESARIFLKFDAEGNHERPGPPKAPVGDADTEPQRRR